MFDDEDTFDEPTEFELWYKDNYMFLRNGDEYPEGTPEVEFFYHSMYKPAMTMMAPLVRKLMYQHFPKLDREMNESEMKLINQEIDDIGRILLVSIFTLLEQRRNGDDLRELYPDFKSLEAYRKKVKVIHRSMFDKVEGLSEKQKQALYTLLLDTLPEAYNYKDQRRYELIEALQPVLFTYFPAMESFGHEEWVVMFHLYSMAYTRFRINFESHSS